MTANIARYGFRWFRSRYGSGQPDIYKGFCASNAAFSNGTLTAAALRQGDLVKRDTDGSFIAVQGTEGTEGQGAFGVVMSIGPYWDGNRMRPSDRLPSNVVYGSNLERQSTIFICPIESAIWEVDVDDAVTATTKAGYQALIGENADHVLVAGASDTFLTPKLDIGTHAASNTLFWRIYDVSPTLENTDFSGANVKLLVVPNLGQVATALQATGI